MIREIKLSFVIPVYNVEQYLEQCVESIISQNNTEIELILVDDGSTDSSGKICDELSVKYPCIEVIHKANGGLASARNAGLEKVQGKYVAFVDSDDYIAGDCMDLILKWIDNEGTDICFLNATKFYPDGKIEDLGDAISRSRILGISRIKVLRYLSSRPKFPGSACTKIYRYSFLKENNLEFPRDGRLSEDLGFTRDCIWCAKSFDALDVPYYFYRQNRQGSITNTVSDRTIDGLLKFINESISLLTKNKAPLNISSKYVMSFVAYEYLILIFNYSRTKSDYYLEEILEKQWVLKYGRTLKILVIRMLISLLGIGNVFKLLKTIKK